MNIPPEWVDYKQEREKHSVVGTLLHHPKFHSPELNNQRDIFVHLPPSYFDQTQPHKRYPVLYVQDGQNLFDHHSSYAGEWNLDAHLLDLSFFWGLEAIAVGIPNLGDKRLDEYSPFQQPRMGGGMGGKYIDFIADTLKPRIDADFRTLPGRDYTGLMGSSMGGLISLYGFFHRPSVFGLTAAMSPALWFANRAIFPYIEGANFHEGRIYLDSGTAERHHRRRGPDRCHTEDTEQMYQLLLRKGYRDKEAAVFYEGEGDSHSEAAWSRRLPYALFYLLRGRPPQAA